MFGSSFVKICRDFIFPPLCVICKERCETKMFCPACWELCSPIDPIEKCPHCFDDSQGICNRCKRTPALAFPKAAIFDETEPARYIAKKEKEMLASFALFQWSRLDWPIPDVVIPLSNAKSFANALATFLHRPIADILTLGNEWKCDEEGIQIDQEILVCNFENSMEECRKAIQSLSPTFPKKGYLLSVFM